MITTLFFILGLPWIVLICLCVPKWREGVEQKFGLIDTGALLRARLLDLLDNDDELQPQQLIESKQVKNIWLHAVSFGEVKTIEPLVYELQAAFPNHKICLSTGTKTGQDLAQKLFSSKAQNPLLKKDCFVFYCPFDFYFAVKNWLTALSPKFIIIAETEIWPELLFQARQHGIPAFIVNGRLTDKSVKKYKAIKPLIKEALRAFKGIFAQSKADQERFLQIGATAEQIEVLSNLKFDSMKCEPPEKLAQLKSDLKLNENTTLLIAGSTHKGEEELACKLYARLGERFAGKDIRLIIAPRHLERLAEVENVCRENKLDFVKRTDGASGFKQVLILDTLGELGLFYGVSQIALLGGTWANIGGHNPLEPATYGLPIFVGPHTHKITDLVGQLQELNLLQQIEDENILLERVSELIDTPSKDTQSELTPLLGGWGALSQQMGVAKRSVELIKRGLDG